MKTLEPCQLTIDQTCYVEVSLARTFPVPEKEKESPGNAPDSGLKCSGSSEKPDHVGSLLRTFLLSAFGGLTGCCLTWKEQATPAGRLWLVLSMPVRHTEDNGCGSWPAWNTPNVMDNLPIRSPEALKRNFKNRPGRATHPTLREQAYYPPPAEMWLTPKATDTGAGERADTFVKRNGDRGEHVTEAFRARQQHGLLREQQNGKTQDRAGSG